MRLKHLTDSQYGVLRAKLSEMLKATNNGLAVLLSVLADTGIRAEELTSILCRDLMPEFKSLHIRGAKGSENRTLPLDQDTYNALESAIKRRGLLPEESIMGILSTAYRRIQYPNVNHAAKQRLRNLWRDLRKELWGEGASHLGLHCLRHTVAIRVLEHTHRDLLKTRLALGHKSINSTVKYVDYLDAQDVRDDVRNAMKVKKTG